MRMCLLVCLCVATPALGQTREDAVARYLRERGRTPVVLNLDAAMETLRSTSPPRVIDIRDPGNAGATALRGAIAMPLARLGGNEARALAGSRVLVVGERPVDAVEGMLLLRLAGADAVAVDASAGDVARRLSAAETPAAEPPQSRDRESSAVPILEPPARQNQALVVSLIVAVLAIGGVLLHFLVLVPRRRLGPVRIAFAILHDDQASRFEEAEHLLATAEVSGLRPHNLAEARFGLAYVRARLGRMEEALSATTPLVEAAPTRESVYLDLWLQHHEGRHDQSVRRFTQHAEVLDDFLDSRLLGGIALLEQAFVAVGRQDYEAAVELFKRLRVLGVLQEHVPADLADQQVAFAVEALFASETAKAREGFARALHEAAPNSASAVYADIGLVLCDWRAEEAADVDANLARVVERVQALLPSPSTAAAPVADAPADQGSSIEHELTSLELLVRNVRLLFAVSLLRNWKRLPAEQGLPSSELDALVARLAAVREIDPGMGDPLLIEGLIRYYFAESESARQAALICLRDAAKREISVPEVNYLVDSEEALAKLQRNRLKDYLALLKQYLDEETVPLVERERVKRRLESHPRFKELGEIDLHVERSAKEASVRDVAAVSGVLLRRVEKIVGDNDREIADLLVGLKSSADDVSRGVADLDRVQRELMGMTAEYLLKEEETTAGATGGKRRRREGES